MSIQDVDSDGMYQEVKSVIQVFPGDAWNTGKVNLGGLGGLGVGYSNTHTSRSLVGSIVNNLSIDTPFGACYSRSTRSR